MIQQRRWKCQNIKMECMETYAAQFTFHDMGMEHTATITIYVYGTTSGGFSVFYLIRSRTKQSSIGNQCSLFKLIQKYPLLKLTIEPHQIRIQYIMLDTTKSMLNHLKNIQRKVVGLCCYNGAFLDKTILTRIEN